MPVGGLGVVRVFVAVWVTGLSERPRRRPRAVLGDPCRHGRADRRGHKRRQGPGCRLPRSVRRPYIASKGTFVTGGEPGRARAFEYVGATSEPPLETIATHGNEEASSGGLKTLRSRSTTRPQVDEQPRDTAITSSSHTSFGAQCSLPGFATGGRSAYGPSPLIPAGYALKPPRPAVMTAFVRLFGPAAPGCDGRAAS